MMRAALMLVMLSLAVPAQAEVIVGNNSATIADAANTPAEEAFTPRNRSTLAHLVSYGCRREARKQPTMIDLSKKTGRDAADSYCSCFSQSLMDRLTMAHVKVMIATRKPDPALQREMVPVANACMREAAKR